MLGTVVPNPCSGDHKCSPRTHKVLSLKIKFKDKIGRGKSIVQLVIHLLKNWEVCTSNLARNEKWMSLGREFALWNYSLHEHTPHYGPYGMGNCFYIWCIRAHVISFFVWGTFTVF